MPRPTSKAALLADAQREHEALLAQLSGMPNDEMAKPGVVGAWSVRDVLAHLAEWHAMVERWVTAGERGETPHVPADGFNWGQLPALNESIRRQHADRPVDEVLAWWVAAHAGTVRRIEGLAEADLFRPGLYPWMNRNTLAAYLTSVTSSHDRWARTEIRKGLRGGPGISGR
ncbi:MAG TPA: ClbS/DfsB family four-helix bundle protein [Candidatus Limnocylindrales bacterium]|nr:ClbS/DfsB family four-helix bundle protein [Candidatus Limnocylindrales bacterium]